MTSFMSELRFAPVLLAALFSVITVKPSLANHADAKAGFSQTGVASYYGEGWDNQPTASGELFDRTALTAAHSSLPLGAWVKVTNLLNGRSVDVRINDRNAPSSSRIIDLSQAAAKAVGMIRTGIARVRIERILPGRANLGVQVAELAPEPPRKPVF